jgi:hypothetical protein
LQDFGYLDQRFGGEDRYHLTPPKGIDMRVPDKIRKSVLFIGVRDEDTLEWVWKGTGYLIAVPQPGAVFRGVSQESGRTIHGALHYPFMFLATAKHVAEKIEGKEFALRVNTLNGTTRIIEGHPNQKWWYHPIEREFVDAAVTIFLLPN